MKKQLKRYSLYFWQLHHYATLY